MNKQRERETSSARFESWSLRRRLMAWNISPLLTGKPSPIQLWKTRPMGSPFGSFSILLQRLSSTVSPPPWLQIVFFVWEELSVVVKVQKMKFDLMGLTGEETGRDRWMMSPNTLIRHRVAAACMLNS